MRPFLFAFLLAAPSFAQTFVVDTANGPGTDYTTIAAATAAVPDGSVLLVRAGLYFEFTIAGKGLKVLCEPGVTVLQSFFGGSPIAVHGLAAHQGVVLRNFRFGTGNNTPSDVGIDIVNCQGSVLLDDVRQTSFATVDVIGSAAVQVRRHRFDPVTATSIRYRVSASNVVLEDCELGPGPGSFGGSAPSLELTGGTLQVADCTIRGGFNLVSAGPAMQLNGGDARLLGATSLLAAAAPSAGASAVVGTGTLRVEPTVTLTGAAPVVAPTITLTTKVMPRVRATLAAGVGTVELTGATGHLAALALALPGPRQSVGLEDALWLDLGTFGGLGATVLGASPFAASLPLPPAVLPGARVVFQGATFDPLVGLQLSNPSFVILP